MLCYPRIIFLSLFIFSETHEKCSLIIITIEKSREGCGAAFLWKADRKCCCLLLLTEHRRDGAEAGYRAEVEAGHRAELEVERRILCSLTSSYFLLFSPPSVSSQVVKPGGVCWGLNSDDEWASSIRRDGSVRPWLDLDHLVWQDSVFKMTNASYRALGGYSTLHVTVHTGSFVLVPHWVLSGMNPACRLLQQPSFTVWCLPHRFKTLWEMAAATLELSVCEACYCRGFQCLPLARLGSARHDPAAPWRPYASCCGSWVLSSARALLHPCFFLLPVVLRAVNSEDTTADFA